MAKVLRRGDRVEWNFGRGKAVGTVKRKLTEHTTIGKQKVAAITRRPALPRADGFGEGGGAQG